jgi:PAS domain S-box-containing protein
MASSSRHGTATRPDEHLLDLLPAAVCVCGVDGGIQRYNRRAVELWGREPGQGPEHFCGAVRLFRPDGTPLDHRHSPMAEVLRTGAPRRNAEVVIERADGSRVAVLANIDPLRDEAGALVGAVNVFQDISERLRTEQTLARPADLLGEEALRKDAFLALLGHELRHPLAPIRNALQVLRLRGDAGTVEWAGGILERQVEHLTGLVDELLDVARVRRGKVRLEPRRLDLAGLVRATAEDHRSLLEAAGLALEVDLPAGPVWVQGDLTRLSQVLRNLLNNASKFTDAGGRVAVRLAHDPASRAAVVTVRDSGVGIDPEVLPRVFDPFAQADHSLDRSSGGLGLGLALVKGLVELHRGQVSAASTGVGLGSEFSFRLPTEGEPMPPGAGSPLSSATRKGLRVLVVEDNRDGAESLRVLLDRLGHEVRAAHTGPEGVEEALRCGPDLVLCDLDLPGLDGCGVAQALRRDPATAGTRLIALSGYVSVADRQRCLEAGFEVLLPKPVEPQELQRRLALG